MNRSRGAARHWLVGCGVLFLLIAVLGGGILFYSVRQVMKNVSVEPVNVSGIADPPKDASPDRILPPTVGSYVRELVTSDTAAIEMYQNNNLFRQSGPEEIQAGGIPSLPQEGLFGVYKDGHQKLAIVGASISAKIQKPPHKPYPWQKTSTAADADNSSGTRTLVKLTDDLALDWTVWTKENWGYAVYTTNTATLDFVKSFSKIGN